MPSEMPDAPAYLFATDLDGTIIPPDRTDDRLLEISALGRQLEGRRDLVLAYVTGRHFQLALEGIETFGLPSPDLLSCDVGTSLYARDGEGWTLDPAYRSLVGAAFRSTSAEEVRAALADHWMLEPQEPTKQAEFKISYYFPADAHRADLASGVQRRLDAAGIGAQLATSFDPETGTGLLDVLPPGISKDFAIRYLHDRTGVEEEHLVYAGDSGNDLTAMLAGYRVIVVGNASEDLREQLREKAAEVHAAGRIFYAQARYAAGVLEGLKHFGVL